jgi:cell wall-associated NlpC family hydrolase
VGSAPVAECLPAAGAAPKGSSVGAKVVRFALAQIGKPYVFAAAGPDAYDCSGLTLAAYASAGVSIGTHSATNQYDTAKAKGDLVPIADAKPGDLLFYTDGGGDMYHVTIYAGNGLMLEAPYPGSTVRGAPVRTGDLVAQAAHFG